MRTNAEKRAGAISSKSELSAGGKMLMTAVSQDELKLLKAVRKLRKEENRSASAPPELLEHGWITPERASELLGGPVTGNPSYGPNNDLFVMDDGRIPISEVLREFKSRRRAHLDSLARPVRDMVRMSKSPTYLLDHNWGYSVETVADLLHLSKAAAKRLMDDELFTHAGRRGVVYVTPEELLAYMRKSGVSSRRLIERDNFLAGMVL